MLTRVISSAHLIGRRDETDSYRGAIQTEWLMFYWIRRRQDGVKHSKISKQQRRPRQVAQALVGKLMTCSLQDGLTQLGRRAVEGLWSQFRERIVSSGAAVVAYLTFGHRGVVVIECSAKQLGARNKLRSYCLNIWYVCFFISGVDDYLGAIHNYPTNWPVAYTIKTCQVPKLFDSFRSIFDNPLKNE